jgi:hypothetical protein
MSIHCKGVTVMAMNQLTSKEMATTVKRVRQYSPAPSTDAKIGKKAITAITVAPRSGMDG